MISTFASASSQDSRTLQRLFPGKSELAARMRAFNWSSTALGPVNAWPENLRVALGICLTSRFPMQVWWGPELTMFYNDAFISLLGRIKHPAVLGHSARDAWPEIWTTIGPMIDSVRATGVASWSEDVSMCFDRAIAHEEVYVTFSFSPVFGSDDQIEGVFCACTETTAKLVGTRRLETLSRLGIRAAEGCGTEGACQAAAEVLASNLHDIPFAAIYTFDATKQVVTLCASAGLKADHPLPRTFALADSGSSCWPMRDALESRSLRVASHLLARGIELPGGPWPEPANQAMVAPISGASPDHPAGLLVVGVSPRRILDAQYCSFFELVAHYIGTALADAQAYEAERQRAEALSEIDRAKTAFFTNISHEFRTPLTLLLGPLEEALELLPQLGGDATIASQLESALRNARRLHKLVNTLLEFARVEAGRVRARFEPTDLAIVTADLASVFRSAVEQAGLELVVDCPPLPAPVCVDREMWERIVLNLLSNAFKFTFEGRIEVSLRTVANHVELSVRDTGTGITSEELPRIFERFHRIEGARARTQEGSGIGLALVQDMVRAHGGEIRVVSRLGEGSQFLVSIGYGHAQTHDSDAWKPESTGVTSGESVFFVEEALRWLPRPEPLRIVPAHRSEDFVGARILIVDDNADMREYLARLLGQRFTVETACDGLAALEAAQAGYFDLILSDIMMPGLDGIGLLHALRADPALAHTPVIMLSARAGEESRIEGLETGADDYLVKPFSSRELLARVETHLKLAARRQLATGHDALEQLHEASTRLLGEDALSTVVETVLEASMALASSPMSCVQLFDPEGATPLIARRGLSAEIVTHLTCADPNTSALPAALELVQDWLVPDVAASSWLGPELVELLDAAGVRSLHATPVLARDGRPLGSVITAWPRPHRPDHGTVQWLELLARHAADLIDHRRREEAVAAARDAALRADDSKSRFLAAASHDLRQPLQAILLVETVLSRALKEGSLSGYVKLLGDSARGMDELLCALLDINRLETGAIQPQLRVFGLDEVLPRLRSDLRYAAASKSLEFEVEDCDEQIRSDPALLLVILRNLIGNAIKYTAHGRVTVRVRCDASELVLEVCDSGQGIPGKHLERIFDAFYQVDNANRDKSRGIGLGLSIVQRVAQLLGHPLSVETREGVGSTFGVRVPRVVFAGASNDVAVSSAYRSTIPPAPLTLLHIEDDPAIARLMSELLSSEGYRVVSVGSREEALLRVDAEHLKPDLIVTDYHLPAEATGDAVVAEIAKRLGKRPPAILLTGDITADLRARAERVVDCVLSKPVEIDVLLRELAELSRRRTG
jgi:signal transduction histidine kinase/DNA-binding response OmpR family regulator